MSTYVYRKALVTYLDILGFSGLVKSVEATKIKRVLSAVARFTRGTEEEKHEFGAKSIAFSDSIVRVRYVDERNGAYRIGLLFHELLDMVHAQAELVKFDVVLRGAITVGEIYFDGATVFGPALVRAYELESGLALYPRVIVDPTLINATKSDRSLGSAHHTPRIDRQYVRNLLARGENGFWYVDYLLAASSELDEPELEVALLYDHRALVIKRYGDDAARSTALDKILWLATYHNRRVSRLPDSWFEHFGVSRANLEIRTSDIPELARLPRRRANL